MNSTPHTSCPRCHGSGHIQDDTALGAAMRAKREAAGIRLREVARRMGCSAEYVRKLEMGEKHWNEGRQETYLESLK